MDGTQLRRKTNFFIQSWAKEQKHLYSDPASLPSKCIQNHNTIKFSFFSCEKVSHSCNLINLMLKSTIWLDRFASKMAEQMENAQVKEVFEKLITLSTIGLVPVSRGVFARVYEVVHPTGSLWVSSEHFEIRKLSFMIYSFFIYLTPGRSKFSAPTSFLKSIGSRSSISWEGSTDRNIAFKFSTSTMMFKAVNSVSWWNTAHLARCIKSWKSGEKRGQFHRIYEIPGFTSWPLA